MVKQKLEDAQITSDATSDLPVMWLCDLATSRFFLVPGWALPGWRRPCLAACLLCPGPKRPGPGGRLAGWRSACWGPAWAWQAPYSTHSQTHIKVCKAEWKEAMPLADVRHGALPLPTYKVVAHYPSVAFHLLRVGLTRGGGMLEHEEQVLPTDVRADMEKKFAAYNQQKAAAKDAGSSGGPRASGAAGSRREPRTTDDSGGSVVREAALGSGSGAALAAASEAASSGLEPESVRSQGRFGESEASAVTPQRPGTFGERSSAIGRSGGELARSVRREMCFAALQALNDTGAPRRSKRRLRRSR